MSLALYAHSFSSYCQKVLIALYENETPFAFRMHGPGHEREMEEHRALWPLAKFPVLVDSARDATVAESTTVVEYLDTFYGRGRLVPHYPDLGWQVRLWDRIFDNALQLPMQKIVGDALRPEGAGDPHGVAEARADLAAAYRFLAARLHPAPWAMGESFTLADCAAAPALFYANLVVPFGPRDAKLHAYLARLMALPSFARVLEEAELYFPLFPLEPKPSRELRAV